MWDSSQINGRIMKRKDDLPHKNDVVETEINRLIETSMKTRLWRKDYEKVREKLLWQENHCRWQIRELKKIFKNLKGKSFLDIGCGKGGLVVALSLEGAQSYGIDIRKRNCRITFLRGLRHGHNIAVIQGNGEDLPFSAGMFDGVTAIEVLEHTVNPLRFISEIKRVLKKDGSVLMTATNRLCAIDPHYKIPGPSLLPKIIGKYLIRKLGRQKPDSKDLQDFGVMSYVTYAELSRVAKKLNFRLLDLREKQWVDKIKAEKSVIKKFYFNFRKLIYCARRVLILGPENFRVALLPN